MSSPAMQDLEGPLASALERHLTGKDGRTPPNLAESIRYSLLAPGKRIRPRLSLACAAMVGLDERAALPPALALEMIHCFTLIHDDLPCMDDDDFRRGKPSNHKIYGEAIALLAGDALMALALDVFLDAAPHAKGSGLATALRRFAWCTGPRGVIGGQAAEALLTASSPFEAMRTMHAQKTGALFSAALLIPMDLAGIREESPEGGAIARFAAELGLAFQIADDLDDAQQDAKAEAPSPTSILHYRTAEQARSETRARLESACRELESRWNEGARPLVAIAHEVLRSL